MGSGLMKKYQYTAVQTDLRLLLHSILNIVSHLSSKFHLNSNLRYSFGCFVHKKKKKNDFWQFFKIPQDVPFFNEHDP